MKSTFTVLISATLLLTSCNGQPAADCGTGVLRADTAHHNDTAGKASPEEMYFGIDSEDDTVVYEQDGKILTSGVVSGTFHHMERHDFMQFVMADSNGMLHRFFMNTDDQRQMDKYYEGYEPARGHPVTVKWERSPLPIKEHGGMETVYQAKEVLE